LTVKLPAKPTLKAIKNILDGFSWRLENLLSRRDACLANDDRIERDLMACTALADYVIDLTDPRDVAERRVEDMSDAGMPPSPSQQSALDNAATFTELCNAYRDIVLN